MTEAWATDHAAGHDTTLLAWRRADVADLNRLARLRWDELGHLHGDDVLVDGGRYYAAGDRLVALAPNPDAGIVTSEPLVVVDVDEEALTVRTSRGREVTLTGSATDVEHLDYGYAVTVHRSQGATYDRAHVLAAGGGRELAYVALSRARDRTTIHATADDLTQAVDDLQTHWGVTHHQRWVTDTSARPGRQSEPASASPPEPAPMGSAAGPPSRCHSKARPASATSVHPWRRSRSRPLALARWASAGVHAEAAGPAGALVGRLDQSTSRAIVPIEDRSTTTAVCALASGSATTSVPPITTRSGRMMSSRYART
jgi:hypothetical protein